MTTEMATEKQISYLNDLMAKYAKKVETRINHLLTIDRPDLWVEDLEELKAAWELWNSLNLTTAALTKTKASMIIDELQHAVAIGIPDGWMMEQMIGRINK